MLKIENLAVFNFDGAIRGLRNPLESWNKSDSYMTPVDDDHRPGHYIWSMG